MYGHSHIADGTGGLAGVYTAECELAVGVVERARRLERDADFVGRDQALRERVVRDRRDAIGDSRDKRACEVISARA